MELKNGIKESFDDWFCTCACVTGDDYKNCNCSCHELGRAEGLVPLYSPNSQKEKLCQSKEGVR